MTTSITIVHEFTSVDQAALEAGLRVICGDQDWGSDGGWGAGQEKHFGPLVLRDQRDRKNPELEKFYLPIQDLLQQYPTCATWDVRCPSRKTNLNNSLLNFVSTRLDGD